MEKAPKITDVIIYCRVSSYQQVVNGHGLESQQIACEKYCRDNRLSVVKVFQEPGIKGDDDDRPAFEALIEYIKRTKKTYIVLVYDITRLARSVSIGLKYIDRIRKLDCRFLNVTQPTEDSPMGQMMDVLGLAFGELWKKTNRETVLSRMDAQLSKGRRMHGRPALWYQAKDGQYLPKEPNATIVRLAYERLASGELNRAEGNIRKFLVDKGFTDHKGRIQAPTRHQIYAMLSESVIMEASGKLLYKGKWINAVHPAIISTQLAQNVLAKLRERKGAKYQTGQGWRFPLRGFIRCVGCGHLMTASRPNGGAYEYYHCVQPTCEYYHKNTSASKVHAQFVELLERIVPTDEILQGAHAVFKRMWEERNEELAHDRRVWQQRVAFCDQEITSAVKQTHQNDNPAVRQALYKDIETRTQEKEELLAKLDGIKLSKSDFETISSRVLSFLKNPCTPWIEGDLAQRAMIQDLIFPHGLFYTPKLEFRNPEYALIFGLIEQLKGENVNLVDPSGFEPLTSCMPCKRSTS